MSKIDPFFNDLAAARSASSGLGGPVESSRDPALRVAYSNLRVDEPLGDDVLAAIVFGGQTPCPADPRCLRIDLEPLAGAGLSEVWRGTGPARIGTAGPIRHVEDGRCLAGWIELEERRFGGLVEAAEAAYRGLLRFQAQSQYHHVWRIWNFVTAINEGEGDAERLRTASDASSSVTAGASVRRIACCVHPTASRDSAICALGSSASIRMPGLSPGRWRAGFVPARR